MVIGFSALMIATKTACFYAECEPDEPQRVPTAAAPKSSEYAAQRPTRPAFGRVYGRNKQAPEQLNR